MSVADISGSRARLWCGYVLVVRVRTMTYQEGSRAQEAIMYKLRIVLIFFWIVLLILLFSSIIYGIDKLTIWWYIFVYPMGSDNFLLVVLGFIKLLMLIGLLLLLLGVTLGEFGKD